MRKHFHFSFLVRFTIVTAIAAMCAACAMSYFLTERHERAVESNEGINAAGQVSAQFTDPMDRVAALADAGRRYDADRLLRAAAGAALQLQYVTAVRVYRPDGSALYPSRGVPMHDQVRRTLALGNLWSTIMPASSIEGATMVQYVPFVAGHATYVLAIDLSIAQMSAQTGQELAAVYEATGVGVALIFISLVALAAGASRELERSRREAEGTFSKTLTVLANIIDRRDPYTAGHSRRVADYARLTAGAMKMSVREQDQIELSALLHDVGKIGIPDAILLKPGRLDDSERAIMNSHPGMGADILRNVPSMEAISVCVLHHHERLDGCGYPHGLRGETIPLGSRILAVADTFDAMTTDRPYRRAMGMQAATLELQRVAGTQLDPAVVEVFVKLIVAGKITPPAAASPEEDIAKRFGAQPLAV